MATIKIKNIYDSSIIGASVGDFIQWPSGETEEILSMSQIFDDDTEISSFRVTVKSTIDPSMDHIFAIPTMRVDLNTLMLRFDGIDKGLLFQLISKVAEVSNDDSPFPYHDSSTGDIESWTMQWLQNNYK